MFELTKSFGRTLLPIVLLIFLIPLLFGCAGNLKERVNTLETRTTDQEAEIATLQRRLESVDKKATDLHDRSDDLLAKLAVGPAGMELQETQEIYFKLNRYDLGNEARAVLDQVAEELAARPNSIVELIGQTDALGTEDYNFRLGERRAEEARRYLRERFGIPLTRLQSASYGELGAVKLSDPEFLTGNQKDRRVQLRVWDRPSTKPQSEGPQEGDDIS